MIDLLLKAIDRVIDLARIRDKRLRARYEEIYKPSFVELQQVHADYQKLIEYVVTQMIALRAEAFASQEHNRELLEHVRTQRLTLLPVRQKLRAFEDFLSGAKSELPTIEYDFLRSIVRYFEVSAITLAENTSASGAILDRLEIGLSTLIHNPEGNIFKGKFASGGPRDIGELIQFCEHIRLHVDSQWVVAVGKFNELRATYAESVS